MTKSISILILAVIALISVFALLMAKHQSNSNDFDKIEQFVNTYALRSKYLFCFVVICIISTVLPGTWAISLIAKGQWLVGGTIILIWVYPYWIFLNYLSHRSLLKIRLEFSLMLTICALALAYYLSQTPNA